MEKFNSERWVETKETMRIDVKDLQIGMYVVELDRPWLETNFWFQGFELTTPADIEAVQAQCEYVYIAISKKTKISNFDTRSTGYSKDYLDKSPLRQPQQANKSLFKKQIAQAEVLHRNTSTIVKSFLEEAKFGRPINTVVAKQAVSNCVDQILKGPDALMLMAQLKNRDEYTAQHSMNVCLYSIALGKQMGLPIDELNNLGLCGMMHDMGKMVIPGEILNKPGRLTPDEMDVMESHAVEGYKILMHTRGMFDGAVDVAHMHHERLDGSGYPRKLRSGQITPYSQMVAIADIYDAITSDRVYKKGKSHLDAIKILNETAMNGHFNSQLTMKFIECMGIYPVGSLVELVTGEVALVIEANPKAKLKPKILVLQDSDKAACNEFIVDLAMISDNIGREDYRITNIIAADECGINLSQYYESGQIRL